MDKEIFDEILEIIKRSPRSVIIFNNITYDNCYCNSRSFYFAHTALTTYERFELSSPRFIYDYMKDALRIECYHVHEYIPVWTKEDGLLKEGNLIKFRGKYITITELENTISNIEEYVRKLESKE